MMYPEEEKPSSNSFPGVRNEADGIEENLNCGRTGKDGLVTSTGLGDMTCVNPFDLVGKTRGTFT